MVRARYYMSLFPLKIAVVNLLCAYGCYCTHKICTSYIVLKCYSYWFPPVVLKILLTHVYSNIKTPDIVVVTRGHVNDVMGHPSSTVYPKDNLWCTVPEMKTVTCFINTLLRKRHMVLFMDWLAYTALLGQLLLTWFNFNHNMEK